MSYLHCHNCDWSQDDFWSERYSPFHGDHWDYDIRMFEDIALTGKLDRKLIDDKWDMKGLELPDTTTYREFFALNMERKARVIRNMAAPTDADWQKIKPEFKCPKCGSGNWDID
jgi:hypothetical protein